MKLDSIIKNLKINKIIGTTDLEISDIVYDSRKVTKNNVFVCLEGCEVNGHDFIDEAIKNGATAIVTQKKLRNIPGVTLIFTDDTRTFLARISTNFFNHPAKKLTLIGITGTKGKTTTSFMIKSILESANIKTGLIGTIGVIIGDNITKLSNTTPESYEIQKYLNKMVKRGCQYAVIEASSIGLKTHRLDGFDFDYGVFTNFSHDHIGENEHESMEEYLECKNMLFKKCKIGFVNMDDSNYKEIIKNHTCKIKTLGINNSDANYTARNINLSSENSNIGIKFNFCGELKIKDVFISIPGKFNVYNALAAASVCNFIGISEENIKKGLGLAKVKGRVELVKISKNYSLFIDYAHNAVSMENILTTLKEYNPSRLITLFGAGGNRPKIRRYEMGEVSGKLSNLSIITSDNPRFENPMDIIEDIKKGINKTSGKYIVIPDRTKAIEYCIKNAKKGDIIVLAGKGHEDYQEINGVKYPMDERAIVSDMIKRLELKVN